MAEETKTFPMKDPGVDNDPDFHSGPNALLANERGIIKSVVSQSSPNTTVKFERRALQDTDVQKLQSILKANIPNIADAAAKKCIVALAKFLRAQLS